MWEEIWITYPTLDPLDPYSGKRTTVRISHVFVDYMAKYRPVDHWNLATVTKVLDTPLRIFYGLRELSEGGWCYVGKPEQWWIREEIKEPFKADMVFCVYFNDALEMYSLRAEYADIKDPLSPRDWEKRYRRLIWKNNP